MSTDHYLSSQAIRKAVYSEAISDPATIYPFVAGILIAAGTAVINPWWLGYVLAAGVSTVGVSYGLSKVLFGADAVERKLYKKHQALMEQKQQQMLDHLANDLTDVGCTEGVRQLEKLNAKFQNFSEMLGRKLKPGELTHSRYMNRAMTVYNATLDSFEEMLATLKSVSAINIDEIDKKLDEIKGAEQQESTEVLKQTLEQRKDLFSEKLQRVDELYSANEAALTLIDVSATELASITTSALEELDLQEAMRGFDECIQRLERYSIR